MQLPFSGLKGSAARVAVVNVDANTSEVSSILRREGAIGMYRGLGIVLTGIIPKNAIRFFTCLRVPAARNVYPIRSSSGACRCLLMYFRVGF